MCTLITFVLRHKMPRKVSSIQKIVRWVNAVSGCGSIVVHQAVKPAVPGSNPASLQPAGTCHSLLGSQQGWRDNCRLAFEGRQRQHKKNTKKIIRNFFYCGTVVLKILVKISCLCLTRIFALELHMKDRVDI